MTSDVTAALSNDTTNNRKLTTYYFNDDVLDLEAENHTAALSNDTTNNRKLTTYYFNDDVLDLEAEDNGPDETQDKSRVAIDDILRANTLEANLKNMTRREPWASKLLKSGFHSHVYKQTYHKCWWEAGNI